MGNNSNLQLDNVVGNGEFTVDAWVKFNNNGLGTGGLGPVTTNLNYAPIGDESIVDKMSAAGPVDISGPIPGVGYVIPNTDGWRLLKQTDNLFWFCFGGGTGVNACDPTIAPVALSTTPVVANTWYEVTAVKTTTDISLYVDGVLQGSPVPMTSFTDSQSTDMLIGRSALEGSFMNGEIDEVEIFNTALTQPEIGAIVNTGTAGNCKKPATCKTISISGSMEGNLPIAASSTVKAGYDFIIPGGDAAYETFTDAGVTLNVICPGNSDRTLTIALPTQTYDDVGGVGRGPATWLPSASQSSSLVYQGSTVSNVCGTQTGHASQGATFTAEVCSTDSVDPVAIRFHYSDNTSGSWSGTASVTP